MTRPYWLPVGVAILLHVVLAVSVAPRFEIDSAFYTTQAEALVERGASLDAEGRPETRYPPGYPLFLAAFLSAGLGYGGAVAAQHVLWIGIAIAVVWLVRSTSGSNTAAAATGLIATLDLPGVQSSISILSETLAAALVMAAVCATWMGMQSAGRSQALSWFAAAGLLAGATALVRPIAIALAVPLAIAVWFGADRRWRVAAVGVLVAVFAVLPAAWTVRNARQTGVATLSSLAGINLLHYRAAGTLAIREPGGLDANLIRQRELLEARACAELEREHGRPCADIGWAQRSRTYSVLAWPIILGDPVATALQAVRALGMIVLGGGASLISEVSGASEGTARLICMAYTAPLALFFVLGVPYWWRTNRRFACLIVPVVLYMFGMALGAEAYSRFRVPVLALYAGVCAGGIEWLRHRLTEPSGRLTS